MKAKMTFHYTNTAGAVALAKAGAPIPAEDHGVFGADDPRVDRAAETAPVDSVTEEPTSEAATSQPPSEPVDQRPAGKKPGSKPRRRK